ncbi:MAG: hypothetical protein V5A61_00820 [Haloarculaceae archaeon]
MSDRTGRLRAEAADRGRRLRGDLPIGAGDRRWLALALLSGCVAVGVYLATNPYPAYGAGLYTKAATAIAADGYVPPVRIAGYTADGVPFAYPPLQLYLLAVVLDLGADPVEVARVLPGLGVLAALVPVYLLGRDITGSRPAGAAGAAAVALNPQLLQWHVSAGGVVRSFAFLYATTAIYAGYHVFGAGDRRSVALGTVAFGATLLAHPTYSLFVVASYLLLWGVRDRSPDGLLRGAVVGLGGGLLAGPWVGWVLATHGPAVFAAAAGTHGGVGGGLNVLAGEFSPFLLLPLPAAVYLLVEREYLLPAWFLAAVLLFEQPRFAYAVAAVLVPAAGATLLRSRDPVERPGTGTVDGRAVGAALLVLGLTVGGGAYLAYEMTLVTDPSTPEFLDDDAVEAMEWVGAETPDGATFIVLGDAAEWFPALTDRTILVGPWGVEWEGPRQYDRQFAAFETVSACHSAGCVEAVAGSVGERPEYVYVPKGRYTVRGEPAVGFGTLERSFDRSPGWERAYENDGVVVYRAVAG